MPNNCRSKHSFSAAARFIFTTRNASAIIGFLFPVFAIMCSSSNAEVSRQQCDAVLQIAEIEMDPSLILNVASDGKANICVFYVSLPPSDLQQSAAAQAAGTFQRLYSSGDVVTLIASLERDFTPKLVEALLQPLGDPRFQTEDGKLLAVAVRARFKSLLVCSEDVVQTKIAFRPMDDVISCGLSETRSNFIVQAILRSTRLIMLIPVAQ